MELLAPHERSLPAPAGTTFRSLGAALGHTELDLKKEVADNAKASKRQGGESDEVVQLLAEPEIKEIEGLHPVQWLETKGKNRMRTQRLADMQRKYGYGAAMNEFLRLDACRGIRRLGGLPSHNLSYEILSDNIDVIAPFDVYTRPENSPYVRHACAAHPNLEQQACISPTSPSHCSTLVTRAPSLKLRSPSVAFTKPRNCFVIFLSMFPTP